MHINLNEFIYFNFELASFYKENYLPIHQYIYKPKVLNVLTGSSLIFILPIVILILMKSFKDDKNTIILSLGGLFYMLLTFLWIGTDRPYHLLILFPFITICAGISFNYIFSILSSPKEIFMPYCLVLLLIFFQNLVPSFYEINNKKMSLFKYPQEVKQLQKYLIDNDIQHIISGDLKPWLHFLLKDQKPKLSYFNNMFFFFGESHPEVERDFKELMGNNNKKFLIDSGLMDSKIDNEQMQTLREKSMIIGKFGNYYVGVIN